MDDEAELPALLYTNTKDSSSRREMVLHTLYPAGMEGTYDKTNTSTVDRVYGRQFRLHGGALHKLL
jgi:hypothetical protein